MHKKARDLYATKGDATSWGCTSAKGDVNSYKKGGNITATKKAAETLTLDNEKGELEESVYADRQKRGFDLPSGIFQHQKGA